MEKLEITYGKINNEYITDLVSVIIPTYNRAKLIDKTLKSIHRQNYRPIECIIVDDGSIDNTKEVIEHLTSKYADSDFTINYIKQNNAGAQVARNNGIIESNGEFIQFLDSDDILYEDKLVHQVSFFNKHANVDILFGDWECGTENKKLHINGYLSDDLITQFLTKRPIANFSLLFRKLAICKIGFWDVSLKRYQEIDYQLRGVLTNCSFAYTPINCGLWVQHDGERINNTNGSLAILEFADKWRTKLLETNIFTQQRKEAIAEIYFYSGMGNRNIKILDRIKILNHIYSLNKNHQIFLNKKFKIVKFFFGTNASKWIWVIYSNFHISK